MITEKQIAELVDQHFQGSEYFLVEVVVKPTNKISVYIDGDQRVTVDICQQLNRFLEDRLDRDVQDFELTVSTAGADKPLKLHRQYKKNIGKGLEIIMKSGDKMTGTLMSVTGSCLTFLPDPVKKGPARTEITINFPDIKTAKEIITFKK